ALPRHRLCVLHASAYRPLRLEHGAARRTLGADISESQIYFPQRRICRLGFRYNCQPIVEAGQALLVDDGYQLDDTFWLVPTPGHSPHHCCVNIRSRGQHAVVIGDLMHHTLQCREPDWSTIFDWDPAQAARSRRKFLTEIAGTGKYVLPIHFPHPTTGLIE